MTPKQERQLCARVSRENGEDPIGTAQHVSQFLLIEVPLPWPRKVWQANTLPPGLSELLPRLGEEKPGLRPQAIQPDDRFSKPGFSHVQLYSQAETEFASYHKQAYHLPTPDVVHLITALLFQPENLRLFSTYEEDTTNLREILVCTHGSRDSCCATLGYPIYQHLSEVLLPQVSNARAWRCSHLGGHRFAATLLDLPGGHLWGHLDKQTLAQLITRQGHPADLRQCYRGWSGLSHYAQVAERELLTRHGWAWLTWPKTAHVSHVDPAADRATVQLRYTPPHSPPAKFHAEVVKVDEVLTLASSGFDPLKPAPLYEVRPLDPAFKNSA